MRVRTGGTASLPREVGGVSGLPPLGAVPRIGFNDSADADTRPDEFFGDVHALGGSIVRRIIDWAHLEPDGPAPDFTLARWRALDAFVARANAENLGVTFEIAWTPDWARRFPLGSKLGGAPTVAAFHDFVDLLSARYPTVKRWGWNEPNCCSIESIVPTPQLAQMLASVYPMLHDRIPGVDVMGGGWCPCGSRANHTTQAQGIRELAAAERSIGRRILDTIALHIYPSYFGRAYGWEPPSDPGALSYDTADFGRIVAELDADFDRPVDFHVTETGWMSCCGGYHGDALDERCQSLAALREIDDARRYSSRVASVEWFLIRDQAPNGTGNVYETGLRTADGTKKLLYGAWASYMVNPPDVPISPCGLGSSVT